MSDQSSRLTVLLKSSISCHIITDFLYILPIIENEVLIYLTILMGFSISPGSFKSFLLNVFQSIFIRHIFRIVMS